MMCSVVSQWPYQALLFTGIERTSQIKPIPELHSAPPPITFLPIGQVAVAPGQRSFDAVTLTISISPFPAFFHIPDWHGDQCQSGIWLGGNKERSHKRTGHISCQRVAATNTGTSRPARRTRPYSRRTSYKH